MWERVRKAWHELLDVDLPCREALEIPSIEIGSPDLSTVAAIVIQQGHLPAYYPSYSTRTSGGLQGDSNYPVILNTPREDRSPY